MAPTPHLNNASAILPYTVREADSGQRETDVMHVAASLAPDLLQHKDLTVRQVSGGITNELYQVSPTDASSDGALVRVYGCNTEVLIDRDVDNTVSAELSRLGTAPTYWGRFQNGRVEGFLRALPVDPQALGSPDIMPLIAAALARMHALNVTVCGPREPVLWMKLDAWLELARRVDFPGDAAKTAALSELRLGGYGARLAWVRAHTEGAPPPAHPEEAVGAAFMAETVFAHNDLLGGNVLRLTAPPPPRGDGSGGVVLIDYEYAAWNARAFDVANHWNEYAGFDCDYAHGFPDANAQRTFLERYAAAARPGLLSGVGAEVAAARVEGMRALTVRYTLASHVFWQLWAVIQAKYSAVDFDYLGYAGLRERGFRVHGAAFVGAEPPPMEG